MKRWMERRTRWRHEAGMEMKRIAVYVVLPERTLLLDVAGPLEVLRVANREQAISASGCRAGVLKNAATENKVGRSVT